MLLYELLYDERQFQSCSLGQLVVADPALDTFDFIPFAIPDIDFVVYLDLYLFRDQFKELELLYSDCLDYRFTFENRTRVIGMTFLEDIEYYCIDLLLVSLHWSPSEMGYYQVYDRIEFFA